MKPNSIPKTSIKQLIVNETRNVLLANLLISCILTWLTLPKQDLLSLLGGLGSAGFGFYPASFLFSSSVTYLLTKMLRKNISTGKLKIDSNSNSTKALTILPKGDLSRSLFMGLFCAAIIAPSILIILNYAVSSEWSYLQAFILNVVYLEALTLVVVPVVILSAIFNITIESNTA